MISKEDMQAIIKPILSAQMGLLNITEALNEQQKAINAKLLLLESRLNALDGELQDILDRVLKV